MQSAYIRVTIPNTSGLHARPSQLMSTLVAQYRCKVSVKRVDQPWRVVPAEDILSLLLLSARQFDELEILAKGVDSAACANAVMEFLTKDLLSYECLYRLQGYITLTRDNSARGLCAALCSTTDLFSWYSILKLTPWRFADELVQWMRSKGLHAINEDLEPEFRQLLIEKITKELR